MFHVKSSPLTLPFLCSHLHMELTVVVLWSAGACTHLASRPHTPPLGTTTHLTAGHGPPETISHCPPLQPLLVKRRASHDPGGQRRRGRWGWGHCTVPDRWRWRAWQPWRRTRAWRCWPGDCPWSTACLWGRWTPPHTPPPALGGASVWPAPPAAGCSDAGPGKTHRPGITLMSALRRKTGYKCLIRWS